MISIFLGIYKVCSNKDRQKCTFIQSVILFPMLLSLVKFAKVKYMHNQI